MGRNIVVCCDGTGNEVNRNLSNVLKFYRCLTKDDEQIVFYDPGVGTLGVPSAWRRFINRIYRILGLAFGFGLDQNVLEAYRFVAQTYRREDQLFFFGFSRGAHTVRIVAAMIHMVGLLKPEQLDMAGYALNAYKASRNNQRSEPGDEEEPGAYFGRIVGARQGISIAFVGVWDTVSSIFVPRAGRRALPFLPTMETLANTNWNPSVRVFRQANAIDERRRFFRLDCWRGLPQGSVGMPDEPNQKQVWFAGYHSDIGGGHPEHESAIAKYPLAWMIEEARAAGLCFDDREVRHLVWGIKRPTSQTRYEQPDFSRDYHDSMNLLWRLVELFPKAWRWTWPRRWRELWPWHLPVGEPRMIADRSLVHQSAILRRDEVRIYKPVNWPAEPTPEPLQKPPPAKP